MILPGKVSLRIPPQIPYKSIMSLPGRFTSATGRYTHLPRARPVPSHPRTGDQSTHARNMLPRLRDLDREVPALPPPLHVALLLELPEVAAVHPV